MPKALIPFFIDDQGKNWTAFEAQLLEVLKLGFQNQAIPIHLTIDKENRAAFESVESAFREKISEDQTKNLMVEYSYQHPLSDTPYLNHKNQWVRDKKGKIDFKVEKSGIIHASVAKVSFDSVKIYENANELMQTIIKLKPSAAKGTYVRSVYMSSTMGVGVEIDTNSFV